MKRAVAHEAAVVEIDERLESVERVLGKLRNFVFLFLPQDLLFVILLYVVGITTYISVCAAIFATQNYEIWPKPWSSDQGFFFGFLLKVLSNCRGLVFIGDI